MCSFIFTSKSIQNIEHVNEFTRYRGPDYTSIRTKEKYTFLHNLLSITGKFTIQPTINDKDSIYCLFNGEIYNYKFFGDFDNDSECLIPLYQEYGAEFTKKLDGEYAVVLVDFKKRLLVITSDVFSTKPIWFAIQDNHIGVASYSSPLLRMGFDHPEKHKANETIVFNLDTMSVTDRFSIFNFDIRNQKKNNFNDWNTAFEESIKKRALNVREKIFIGLSSGYDSGAIACELLKNNIPFKSYTVIGKENINILTRRFDLIKNNAEYGAYNFTDQERAIAHAYILKYVEIFKYRIYSASSNYNEFDLNLQDDNGSNGLSFICSRAKAETRKIYLSGQGSDEIFADYGFGGNKKYPHSNFGGLFPDDLSKIFPWPSFYESSMVSYLTKEENVAGSYGLEARYPFLDPKVVQEFLWLSIELKNMYYKSVLHNYLTVNKFPFNPNEKIGF